MKKQFVALCMAVVLLFSCSIAASAAFGTGVSALAKDAPLIKTGLLGEKITFTDKDFKKAFGTVLFSSITVTSLPKSTEGVLMLGGRRVGINQKIERKNLSSLIFLPASKDVTECKFLFTSKGIFGGSEIECQLKFVDKINYAPELLSDGVGEMWTQSGIGVFGKLSAYDPEGDALEVMILEYPKRGILEEVESDGTYCYTSNDGYVGRDSFRYCIRDEYGNYTSLCRMEIQVVDRLSTLTFADMEGRAEYNASLVMSAEGIMHGTVVGDHTLFYPDKEVTRAEFVAMAMKRAGMRQDTTLGETFFEDNGEIPTYLVGYVATAARLGIVNGSFEGERGLIFRPNDTISFLECAMILSNIYDLKEESEAVFSDMGDIPVWAKGAVGAMVKGGFFDTGTNVTAKMTRADVAEVLLRVGR